MEALTDLRRTERLARGHSDGELTVNTDYGLNLKGLRKLGYLQQNIKSQSSQLQQSQIQNSEYFSV